MFILFNFFDLIRNQLGKRYGFVLIFGSLYLVKGFDLNMVEYLYEKQINYMSISDLRFNKDYLLRVLWYFFCYRYYSKKIFDRI